MGGREPRKRLLRLALRGMFQVVRHLDGLTKIYTTLLEGLEGDIINSDFTLVGRCTGH